jgi:hypothetical protein
VGPWCARAPAPAMPALRPQELRGYAASFVLVEGAYTQQGRAYSRRLHPDRAARPALMSRAAHAVESKAVVLLLLWRGFMYSKAQENPRASPPRGGGGGG